MTHPARSQLDPASSLQMESAGRTSAASPLVALASTAPWPTAAATQGLTLVHFSAQRERLLWGKGHHLVLFRGYLGGDKGVLAGV